LPTPLSPPSDQQREWHHVQEAMDMQTKLNEAREVLSTRRKPKRDVEAEVREERAEARQAREAKRAEKKAEQARERGFGGGGGGGGGANVGGGSGSGSKPKSGGRNPTKRKSGGRAGGGFGFPEYAEYPGPGGR